MIAPTGPCCDNCIRPPTPPPSRPQTPQSTPSSSAHSTPSKTANSNGKRPMRRPRGDGPSVRRKDHLKAVRSALDRWRVKTVLSDQYSETSFTAEAILPNPNLTTLASNARLRTVEDIVSTLKPPWMMARRHGQEILTLLDRLDRADREARHAKTLENRETRKCATAARNAAKKANTGQSAAPPLMGSTSYKTTPFTPARTAPFPGQAQYLRIYLSHHNPPSHTLLLWPHRLFFIPPRAIHRHKCKRCIKIRLFIVLTVDRTFIIIQVRDNYFYPAVYSFVVFYTYSDFCPIYSA
jgi:bloom syndrome protein